MPCDTTDVQRALNAILDLFTALVDKAQSAQIQVRL